MSLASALPDEVHARAPGKLNLFFQVGPLGSDGYHGVASVYQAVSLYEDVIARHADDFGATVTGDLDVSGVPTDDRNLAVRAAGLVARERQWPGGIHLDIRKSVPVAGGMGGGSADAAAALVAVDALLAAHAGSPLSGAALHALAARLGADVPFALHGGTAVGTGRGDDLAPALAAGRFDWVVVTSGEGLSTPVVYGELDRLRDDAELPSLPQILDVDPEVLRALRGGNAVELAAHVRNDLQRAALSLRPDLAGVLDAGTEAGALAAVVSGSGPTVAFLAADATGAARLVGALAAEGHDCRAVHGPVRGAHVVS